MNVVIIKGHPNKKSYNYAIAESFKKGCTKNTTHKIDAIDIIDFDFNLNIDFNKHDDQPIEQDILTAQEKIKQADHIVWIYPLWWGTMPALLKGFIDRVFTPGFAFKYREDGSGKWDKLLTGKTSEIICTIDYPIWALKWVYAEAGVKVMRNMILKFCGIKTKRTTYLGPIINSTPEQREKWLLQIEKLASRF